jgi:hypothetical protein
MARFTAEVALTSPAPILPGDFAALARRHPSVGRALALNLYDADAETSGHDRTVSVIVVDQNGAALSSETMRQVRSLLLEMREVNWRCPVAAPPAPTAVDVAFEAIAWHDADHDAVRAAALAELAGFLSPAVWGVREDEPGGWVDEPLVRYLEVAEVLQRVPGLRYVTRLEIGLEGRTLGMSDVTLDGPGALAAAGSGITGTVREGT